MENQTEIRNWRENIKSVLYPKLQILDGQTATLTFLDEGNEYKHPDYKPSIVFTVQVEGSAIDKNTWFVNAQAFGTLNQIMALGDKITGVKVKVTRTGSKKSDTRYTIKKV